ncbi:MAG: AEC family transporter [Spirochaetales bacterium]|nr:AEC family transporter [Spirochaetales bacterium]
MIPALLKSATLVLMMAAGFLAWRLRVLTREAVQSLSRFLVDFTLPALIIMSMQRPFSPELRDEAFLTLGISSAVYAVSIPAALLLARLIGAPRRSRGTYAFAASFSNVAFMGFPVMEALFGRESLFAVSVNNIPFQVLAFSAGIVMIAPGRGHARDGAGSGGATSAPRLSLRSLVNPAIIATFVGFAFFLFSVRVGEPLRGALEALGSVTTPLSMVLIGAMLARAKLGRTLGEWRVWILSAWRLFVHPVALWLGLRALGAEGMILAVPVVVAAMPVAANTSILAEVYGGDSETASGLVFLSTVLSTVSIPLLSRALFGT